MLARPATLRDPGTPDQIVMEQQSRTHILRVSPGARCASNPEDVIHPISLTTDTWVTEAACRSRASSWEQTLLLETSTRRWCPTPRRWTCPYVCAATAKWVRDLGYERFCLHGDTEGVLQLLLDKWQKNCRSEGQDWQILQQVSPTQSHQTSGAAEKAVSTVRGQARTCLAVLTDKIPSFEVTTHSPILPWTIRHAAWILTRYNVRRDTRMTLYENFRGQKYRKEILPLGEQVLARRPGANVNQLLQQG